MTAKIGYKNLFVEDGVTVTFSSEVAGYEAVNAYDWFGYDWWKPSATGDSWIRASFGSAKNADYMSIWGHNLGDHGSSVKAQYSTDGGSIWNDAFSAVSPSDNNTLMIDFTSVGAADWRVLANNPTTIAQIAGIMIGETLDMPHAMEVGFVPPTLMPVVKLSTSRSESGVFIGGSQISQGIKGDFELTFLDPAWVRSDWKPFLVHTQTPKPFVFSWDIDNFSDEVVLAWLAGPEPTPPVYIDSLYMAVSLQYEGTL